MASDPGSGLGGPRVERAFEGGVAHADAAPVSREPLLRVIPTRLGAGAVLALVGELDRSNTDTVRSAVERCLEWQPEALSLDLSGVTYCGAAGMHCLSWALRRAEAAGATFGLVAPPAWLRRALTAIQAHDLLAVVSGPT